MSVALELLTKPSLLFLDEPTSGLDPGMDRDVMQLLRGLADDGRTVLVVTHSVAELSLCDRVLVMAPGGSVAYFGAAGRSAGVLRPRELGGCLLRRSRTIATTTGAGAGGLRRSTPGVSRRSARPYRRGSRAPFRRRRPREPCSRNGGTGSRSCGR
ncbi:ABC transporter ATP-binding protein OS=Streptomyces antimycoticus OX=68175 GN=SSPO_081610 PE=4 SV=1 [Streptomyces antimycoticus]